MSSTASIANSSFLGSRIMTRKLSPRRRVWTSGSDAGRAETALLSPACLTKRGDDRELRASDPGEDELRDAVAGIDHDPFGVVLRARRIAVPGRDQAGAFVVGVDQPDRV